MISGSVISERQIHTDRVVDRVRVLCLMAYHRPGSKLFHSLLDWHPQIMCFPRTLHFNKFWNTVKANKDDTEYVVNAFIKMPLHYRFFSGKEWHRVNKFDRANQLGPDRNDTFSVDVDLFRRYAVAELSGREVTRARTFVALHVAYHLACGREVPEEPLILNHIHTIPSTDELGASLEDFPDKTYVLVLTRDAVDGFNACVNILKLRNTLRCGELFHYLKLFLDDASILTDRFRNFEMRHQPIEHTHRYHMKTMESFVKWVGIGWDDSLMVSTMHGKLYWGNGKNPRNGTDPLRRLYRPKGILERKDRVMFSNLLPHRTVNLGYADPAEWSRTKVRRWALLFLIVLPTTAEWRMLKYMLSGSYWQSVMKDIKNNPQAGNRKVWAEMLKKLRPLNPISWSYYFLKRVSYYTAFAVLNKGDGQKVRPLLDESVFRERK